MPSNFDQPESLKVLISAYACEPGKGSEPGVGWSWVKYISQFAEVWVVTRTNNRPAIEAEMAGKAALNVHFNYVDLPSWAAFWKRGRRGLHTYYYLWQVLAYFAARKLHRRIGFNVAHHVSLGKYWVPSLLALLPVTFIWGPVGGGQSVPLPLWRSLGVRGKVYELLREIARQVSEFDPLLRLTARRAALALAANQETGARLRALGCRKIAIAPQEALDRAEIVLLGRLAQHGVPPFRVLSIGNLVHLKGFHLGLRAFARFQERYPRAEYWLIGDGPERQHLKEVAVRLGVSEKVNFLGSVLRNAALEKLADCDVLLHPALHESGGWVTLEAMAAGRPVVCLNLAGPALQVTGETGIKVEARSAQQVVRDLAAALESLAKDPQRCGQLGEAGRERVREHFNWANKVRDLAQIYEYVRREQPCQALVLEETQRSPLDGHTAAQRR